MSRIQFSSILSTVARKRIAWLLLALLLLALPQFANQYYIGVLISIASAIILSAGVRLIWTSGRLTAGHAVFVGLGAYASTLLVKEIGMNFWLGLLFGGVVAGIMALIIGAIVLRTGGIYFAIITLAIGQTFVYFLRWADSLTGGADGIYAIPRPVIFGFHFSIDKEPYYYLILFIMLVALWFMYRLDQSRVGQALHAMRQDDVLAQHVGINIFRYRLIAFVTACFFAGVVGSFNAHYRVAINPVDFTLLQSFNMLANAIIGGIASFTGPVVGASFMNILLEALRKLEHYYPLVSGGILLLIVIFLPKGLVGLPPAITSIISRIRGTQRKPSTVA